MLWFDPHFSSDSNSVDDILEFLQNKAQDLESQSKTGVFAWRHRMRDSFRAGGKVAYAWLKDTCALHCVQCPMSMVQ